MINKQSLAGCMAVKIRAYDAKALELTSVRRLRGTSGSLFESVGVKKFLRYYLRSALSGSAYTACNDRGDFFLQNPCLSVFWTDRSNFFCNLKGWMGIRKPGSRSWAASRGGHIPHGKDGPCVLLSGLSCLI